MPAMTPMMRQYFDIKERNEDCILFFRMGDFYEMFGDDARLASRELELTLTTRDRAVENPDERMPMCGVPYHSSEGYIARLIAKGYKVAICEQMEDPALAKGLVERDIVRIVTPGTVIETSMLDESRPNYVCAVYIGSKAAEGQSAAICYADLSTGEISVTEFARDDMSAMRNELGAIQPAEAILCETAYANDALRAFLTGQGCLTQCAPGRFERDNALSTARRHFAGGGIPDETGDDALRATGALLSYIIETQKTDISHLRTLRALSGGPFMELDMQTMRGLELVAAQRTGDKRGSLLGILDKTKTPMGRRLLRTWVLRPLRQAASITRRLNAVSELVSDTVARGELINVLRGVGDMERLIGKIVYGSAGCRDLKALSSSIRCLPDIAHLLAPMKSAELTRCAGLDALPDIEELIERAVCDDPPFSVREGGMIRDGYNPEVDRLRGLLTNSTDMLADIERRERERTGKKLKVGYNKVFGYYIELPRSVSDDVPGDYIRKQTLSNCERFITQELKELEGELLTAKDKLASLEFGIFSELREQVAGNVERIQGAAAAVANLDALCSLADTAVRNNYCMPEVDLSGIIDIKDGRHPVVEVMNVDELFVPNDAYLDREDNRAMIITGPNMAGKSTFMRQTALIVLMTQMGSFVPAKSARVGVVDRVFTRIGASDDLSAGKSTFMVEMTEVADILKSATRDSLLILDEIGRGTSTYDGMSVARAVLEHCADKRRLGAKTLFSTHYHELTELESASPGVNATNGIKNYSITAKKRGDGIIFLRKIVPGGADDSYGIEVASLAGVPDTVIKRAKAVLRELESDGAAPPASAPPRARDEDQITMQDMRGGEIADILREKDLNTVTPLEALNLLYELKKRL